MMRTWVVVLAIAFPVTAFGQEPEPTAPQPPPGEAGAPVPPEAVAPRSPMEPMPPPEPNKFPEGLRLMVSDLTIIRLNPTGLETRARVGVQKKLFASAKPITENNFAFGGVFPKLNPASAHIGFGGEIQPASIFNLRSFLEVSKYFGTFGYLQSF